MMKMSLFPSVEDQKKFGWADILVIFFIIIVFLSILKLGSGMRVPFSVANHLEISLNPMYLPYYAGRSLIRMFLAFGASLIFTFVYGRMAARNPVAEKIMIPVIDVLQSVPVLGFLSVTVMAFMSLFPGSLLGVECASIFAIFTSQVWNMTFSFYHSQKTIPRDLQEAARINKLRMWSQFSKLEVPYSMIGLVWNSMMSFGGGWFFLAASESISVLNQDIRLPGMGSYIATAIVEGNLPAMIYSIFTMIILIILVDQLFWRPLVAWAQKFKNEQTESSEAPTSWFYNLLRRAKFLNMVIHILITTINNVMSILTYRINIEKPIVGKKGIPLLKLGLWCALCVFVLYSASQGVQEVARLSSGEILKGILLGLFTAIRVFIATLLGMMWTIPVGVYIGLNPKFARIAQPIVLILASFPANMTFPFLTILYLKYGVNMEVGSIPLMMLGTQWYILFNVIAGAMAIPSDLREASKIMRLSPWNTWKRLIFPGIFPFLVTGGITASGGAWNASIVSELVVWKDNTLHSTGLGAYITQATNAGNWPAIIWGIIVMSIMVVLINRLFWRRLYSLAAKKYHMD